MPCSRSGAGLGGAGAAAWVALVEELCWAAATIAFAGAEVEWAGGTDAAAGIGDGEMVGGKAVLGCIAAAFMEALGCTAAEGVGVAGVTRAGCAVRAFT